MDQGLFIGLLGPTLLRRQGQTIELTGERPRRLLIALAIDAGRVVTGDQLIDRVWDDEDLPADPRAALRTTMTRLRQTITEDAIATDSAGWRLKPETCSLDVDDFEGLLVEAATPNLDALGRLARLEEALGLWRGEPFADANGAPWVHGEADRLRELQASAVERKFQAMLDSGMHSDAIASLAREIEDRPYRDELVGLQMLALFRGGRQVEALAAFQSHRDRLVAEVGLEPGRDLVDLDRRIVVADPSLHLASPAGQAMGGYRLGEQLGEGAFAVVYRGTQPSVGRDVAVKVIRSELANRPDFVRRFEAEAHLVARLEHPFIVPLYDYWREPGQACLVFRYLRGGSLEMRVTSVGALTQAEVGQMVAQLGSALDLAHSAGVIHRDIKPANILLDEDGNYYLGDFGIALEESDLHASSAEALSAGSPAYASPEQLRREPVGPPADIHGLAISAYEALTAQLPFPDVASHAELLQRQLHEPIPPASRVRQDLPSEVDAVLARATAKDPLERYQVVEEFMTDFAGAIAGAAPGVVDPTTRGEAVRIGVATRVPEQEAKNPYKGLRAFTEADEADFRGRSRLVERLVSMVGRDTTGGRVLMVVGPSGIGKSSVVRAGLIPALRRGAVEGSDEWFIVGMQPGRDPFGELCAALLRVATHVPDDMVRLLEHDHRGLSRVAKALMPEDSGSQVLLMIDQFEELFTMVEDPATVDRFLSALEYAVADTRCPIRLVMTMRADFWDKPLRYGSFARLIEQSTVNVTTLAPDELERAIIGPARSNGCEFEPGLVAQIVADISDQPGGLPLLQYLLTELWEEQVSGLLTTESYNALGGVAGALARRAEELHTTATAAEQDATRRLFGRLVTPGEEAVDTRRRVLQSEVMTDASTRAVLERYGAARLLSFDRDPASHEPTVEVAHEALIVTWPRLVGWLDEDRDAIRLEQHLQNAASEWDAAGRPDAELYRGGRLEAATEWAADQPQNSGLIWPRYLAASVELRDREQEAAAARLRQQVRVARRLRVLLTAVACIAVVAVVAGAIALRQRARADDSAALAAGQAALAAENAAEATDARDLALAQTALAEDQRDRADLQTRLAETRRLIADSAALSSENRDLALLLAVEAHRRDAGPRSLAALGRVLSAPTSALGVIGRSEDYLAAGWTSSGAIVGVQSEQVLFYDRITHERTETVALPERVASPNPGFQSPFYISGETALVGLATGSVAVVEAGSALVLPASDVQLSALSLSPDGTRIAIGDSAGVLWLIDRESGRTIWSTQAITATEYADVTAPETLEALPFLRSFDAFTFQTGPRALLFTPEGDIVAAAGVHVRKYSAESGDLLSEFQATTFGGPDDSLVVPRPVFDLDLDDDGELSVVAGAEVLLRLDADLVEIARTSIPTGRSEISVGARGHVIDAHGESWFVLNNGQLTRGTVADPLDEAERHATGLPTARSLTLSPDGNEALIAGTEGLVRWSLDGSGLLATALPRHGNTIFGISSDGSIVTASNAGDGSILTSDTVGILDSQIYDAMVARRAPETPMTHAFTPVELDSVAALAAYGDGQLTLLDRIDLKPMGPIFTEVGVGQVFSRDGTMAALGGAQSTTAVVVETASGRPVSPMLDLSQWSDPTIDIGIRGVTFDPLAGHLLVWLSSGTMVVYETASWQVTKVLSDVATASFSPSGGTLATQSRSGTVTLLDPATFEIRTKIFGETSASELLTRGPFISADDQYLLAIGDGSPRMWHLPTLTDLGGFPNDPGLLAGAASGDGQLQLVTGAGPNLMVWNLETETWATVACRAAGRNLTADEWEQYGPTDSPRRASCPNWPVE